MNKQQLFELSKRSKNIEIEGQTLKIRKLTVGEVMSLQSAVQNQSMTETELMYHLISYSVLQDDGNQMLSVEDVKELSMDILKQLSDAVYEYNGMKKTESEKEAELKN